MKFNLNKKGGVKVHFVPKGESVDSPVFVWAKEHEKFEGKGGQLVYFPKVDGEAEILLGVGDLEELSLYDLRTWAKKLAKLLQSKGEREVELSLIDLKVCNRKVLMAIYEGFRQVEYRFLKKEEEVPAEITVNYTAFKGPEEKLMEGLNRIQGQLDGVFFARDLVNETSNVIYPETLAQKAVENLSEVGVNVTVYDKKQIEEMGMEAFLSVGKGSDNEPRFIVMEYKGNPDSKEVTGLVGKGLTYDSGGYSIKTPGGMVTMHCDMGGAGTVIGTMYALGKTKAKANVTAVVAACENLISGHAYKTGDIISSLSGKTIEVVNTDAEGRITLADAMYYITNELKVDRVIDLATLTGAVLSALGEEYTGALTNNQEFFDNFQKAADLAGEKVWQLPNDKAFKLGYKSKVADFKNSGGRYAGTITAGQFVGEFVANDIPWIHLDIAGTAYLSKENAYLPELATGVHVKALYNLVAPMDEC